MKKNIIIITSIIVFITIINYLFILAPERKRQLKISDTKLAYEVCVMNAEEEYFKDWANQCAVKNEDAKCFLATISAENVNKRLKDKKDRCFDNYKLELSLIK